MAQLTDYLPSIMSGKETQRPYDPGPSLFEQVAEGVSRGITALEGAAETNKKRAAARRQAQQDAEDASDRGAKNYAAEAILAAGTAEQTLQDQTTPQFTGGTPISQPNSNPPSKPLTQGEIEELTGAQTVGTSIGEQAAQWQRGVKQGRLSASQYEMMLESALREGFRKFPQSKFVMLEEIKKYGVEHPIMSEYRMAQKELENEAEAQGKREEQAIDFAVTKLGMDPNHPRETLISSGYRGLSDEYAIAQARAKYDHDIKVAGNSREEIKRVNDARDLAVGKFVHGQLATQFGAALDQFNTFVQDKSIPETERLRAASEFINVFRPKATALIDQSLLVAVNQHGMTQATADAERKRLMEQVDSIFEQFSADNPLNVIVTNGKILQTMKDRFQLDLQDAMPVYMQFKQAFGSSEAVDTLVETVASDPDLSQVFTRELQGFQGLTQGDKTVRLRNLLAFMGDRNTSLRDYTPEESANIIKDSSNLLNNGLYSQAKKGNTSSQRIVLNALGKVSNAAIDLNKGSSTRSLINAMNFIANGNSYDTLKALTGDNKELGGLVADEMRVATGKALMSLTQQKVADPYHAWSFNEKTKKFEIVPTGVKARRQTAAGGTGFMRAEGAGVQMYTPAPSKELSAMVYSMNRGLNFLVTTTNFEDNPILKNASYDEKVRFYVKGELPAAAQPKEGEKISGAKQISRLQNFWANVKIDWKGVPPVDIEGEVARTTGRPRSDDPYNTVLGFGQFGQPPRPLTEMTIEDVIDFGKNVLIPNSKAAGVGRDKRGLVGSSAAGAFQITQETLKEVAPEVLGEGWKKMMFSPDVQDRLGKYLFEQNKGGNLKKIWEGLPNSKAGAYANKTWEEMKEIIMDEESR